MSRGISSAPPGSIPPGAHFFLEAHMRTAVKTLLRVLRPGAAIDGLTYLLRAVLADHADDAAPITSPLTCVPGPGTLTAIETDGATIAIASNELRMTGSGSSYDHCVVQASGDIDRAVGRALYACVARATSAVAGHIEFDINDNDGRLWWHATRLKVRGGGNTVEVLDPADYTALNGYVTIPRSVGGFFVLNGKLNWVNEKAWSSSIQPRLDVYSANANALRVSELAVIDLPDNGFDSWGADFSTVTDLLTNPGTGTAFDCSADCHVTGEFTCENTKQVLIDIRYTDSDNRVTCAVNTSREVKLNKAVGGVVTVIGTGSTLTDGVTYRFDIIASGSSVQFYIDRALEVEGTITDHQTVAGGNVRHTLATNDLTVESHPFPSLGIATDRLVCPVIAGNWDTVGNATYTPEADNLIRYSVGAVAQTAVHIRAVDDSNRIYVFTKNTGDIIVKEVNSGATTDRITGGEGTVGVGDVVTVVTDGTDVALYVETTQIGTYGSLAVTTMGEPCQLTGAAGSDLNDVQIFPRDVSDKLPADWSP
jgi:hypothetical protein